MEIKKQKCIDISYQGYGIVKYNNKVILVQNLLPEEIADIKIIKKQNKVEYAIVQKFHALNNEIRQSNIFYGFQNFAHLNYTNQIKYKTKIANKYLKNINLKINKVKTCKENINYRNKSKYLLKENKVTSKIEFGYQKIKTNEIEIFKIEENLVDKKIHLKTINVIVDCLNKYNYKIKANDLFVVIKSNNKDEMLIDITNLKINEFAIIKQLKEIENSIIIDNMKKQKNKYLIQDIDEINYAFNINAFLQINHKMTHKIYQKIKNLVNENNQVIIDCYGGIGTIGIFAKNANQKLNILEVNQDATNFAKQNLKINNIKGNVIKGDVANNLNKYIKQNQHTTIILDPPRSGLDPKTVKIVMENKPNQIIYMACEGMTFVRDLKQLQTIYDIDFIDAYDMFPQTNHIEYLANLSVKKENL